MNTQIDLTPLATPFTALVLAAGRRGAEDSVARLQKISHKCFVTIDGEVMLERVIAALFDSGAIDRVLVSIEDASWLKSSPRLKAWFEDGRVLHAMSQPTLADSIFAAAEAVPDCLPLVITTGDNALHTPELVRDFCDQFLAADQDVAIAFTDQATVDRAIPGSGLNYHQLKDGGWSACNLYGLRNKKALASVETFRGGGQFGKKHWRILKAFGLTTFILYKLKAVTLADMTARTGRGFGLSAKAVVLPYAYGPIDVDNPASFHLSERLLQERRQSKG
ncbi:hypothetical protein JCM17846_24760 [Iodidimonas nitroreducens]|uniref:MobA-like NTP transferase domain-containing protein n=1 Tax=Iodidimonas nitroreducens TaxID=1236968 RepID=A0A5A7NAN9_9PROT|nr:nucleotidyltransferase family protein [Iodidimonas nitroreducens]GAK33821.1 GTP:adenosylcobinamide-phosphate guanylyltransferase [alpha proteobacterium Q-1]GER04794.1 hypothetical protein JCM17846_24760 [Iodidimonas nitroreducens]